QLGDRRQHPKPDPLLARERSRGQIGGEGEVVALGLDRAREAVAGLGCHETNTVAGGRPTVVGVTADLDVVALGSAIVDVLANATDDLVEAAGLVKGTMALVDEAESARIYA